MKGTSLACLCAGVVSVAAQSPLPSANGVVIAGFAAEGESARYTVSASNLPSTITWNPDQDRFPQELSALTERAVSFLDQVRQMGGDRKAPRFELDDIEIKRVGLSARQLNAIGISEGGFTNQWLVAVTFHGEPVDLRAAHPVARKHVVMLLDGTCAVEEKDPFRDPSHPPKWSVTDPPPDRSKSELPARTESASSARNARPHSIPNSRDLPIGAVQWDYRIQSFPLELGAQASRARDYLVPASDSRQRPTLPEIHLWRYLPVEAARAAETPITAHPQHWLVVFQFRGEGREDHDVLMLLDKTILPPPTAMPAMQAEPTQTR